MAEARAARGGAAAGLLLAFALVAAAAPLVASDRPLLARLDGRLVAPALAALPIAGRFFDDPAARLVAWQRPPRDARVLLMPPVPYSYRGVDLDAALRPPGRRHLLGTDALGRDLLARLIHGARPSLLIGLAATAGALLLGGLLGGVAGLRGGAADLVVVRLIDLFACFPPFVLVLAIAAGSGHGGALPIILGIALGRWTGTARYVRAEILRHRGSALWAAARASGATLPRAALRHLLPLCGAPLLVIASFGVAHAIILESGLSFVGYGIEPPEPSWGTILAESRATLDVAWWPVLFPALLLFLVLGALCAAAEHAASGGGRPGGAVALS